MLFRFNLCIFICLIFQVALVVVGARMDFGVRAVIVVAIATQKDHQAAKNRMENVFATMAIRESAAKPVSFSERYFKGDLFTRFFSRYF